MAKSKPEAAKKDDPPMAPVMPDATSGPVLSALGIASQELRAGILVAQGKLPEAKLLYASAARDEKKAGYHEPPVLRPPRRRNRSRCPSRGQRLPRRESRLRSRPHRAPQLRLRALRPRPHRRALRRHRRRPQGLPGLPRRMARRRPNPPRAGRGPQSPQHQRPRNPSKLIWIEVDQVIFSLRETSSS